MKTVYEVLEEMLRDEEDALRFIAHFRFISQEATRERIAALKKAMGALTSEEAGEEI